VHIDPSQLNIISNDDVTAYTRYMGQKEAEELCYTCKLRFAFYAHHTLCKCHFQYCRDYYLAGNDVLYGYLGQ